MNPRQPSSTLFPYTTLFRSEGACDIALLCDQARHLVQSGGLALDVTDLLVNRDRKSTRLNSSHLGISYAVFCLKKKKLKPHQFDHTGPDAPQTSVLAG